jgi:hypothetical protein
MNVTRRSWFAFVLAAGSIAAPAVAGAEEVFTEGGYIVGMFPAGDWGEVAGAGIGLDGTTFVRPDPTKLLNLRSTFGWGYNFGRSVGVPTSNLAAGDVLNLETSNTSMWFGLGPELGRGQGDLRAFVFGTAGFNVHWTNSELNGTVGGQRYDANVGHSGTVFAWSAGLGLRRAMSSGPGGKLEISAEFRSGVGFDYVVPGEVTSTGAGVQWDRTSHDANMWIIRLGTVFEDAP